MRLKTHRRSPQSICDNRMAPTSKLSDFVVSCFPPRVVVFADADVDNAVEKKFGAASFQQLLAPWARLDNTSNVQIVDLNSTYVNLPNFTLDLVTPESVKAAAETGGSVEGMQNFRRRLNTLVTDHFGKAADRDGTTLTSHAGAQEHEKLVGNCFELFAVDFVRNLPLYELQYLRCCLAAIYVVASHSSDALTRLISLSGEESIKTTSVKWLSSSVYKFFVLLHDTANPLGVKREAADAIYQQMKSTFGGANVHLCVLNTSSNMHAGNLAEATAPVNLFDDQLPTISGSIVPLTSTPQQPINFLSQLSPGNDITSMTGSNKSLSEVSQTVQQKLSSQDADALKSLLRSFVRDGLVPYAERQIRAYHQNITVSRRSMVTRSLFSGATKLFGGVSSGASPAADFNITKSRQNSAPVQIIPFPDESVHAQTRRCADVSFLFRQYDLAAQMYHSLRRDVQKQQQAAGVGTAAAVSAWLHYAAASEMCALSTYLSKPAESYANAIAGSDAAAEALPFLSYFKDALTQYSSFSGGGDDRLVVRCGIFYAQVLLELENFEAAANVFVKLANENEPSLLGALLLEQASICFNRQLMHRKYAFFIVLAGFRFAKAGLHRPALQCFKQALAAYSAVGLPRSPISSGDSTSHSAPVSNWHRGWHLIAERVHYLMARQCMQFNDFAAALQHLHAVVEVYKQQLRHRHSVVENDSFSSSKAAKTMHSLVLNEYGTCQARLLVENSAEKRDSSSLLLIHDQNVQVFFFPFSCDNDAFRAPAVTMDHNGALENNIWHIPDETTAVHASNERSVMEQFALAHQRHHHSSSKDRHRAHAPGGTKGTVFYCGAATENKAEPQPFCGDPVIVCIHLSNPFAVAVELSDVSLLYTFSEQKPTAKSTETVDSDASPTVLTLQPVDASITDGALAAVTGGMFTDARAVILRPYAERYPIVFRVTPRLAGYVNIVGMRYSLRAAVTSAHLQQQSASNATTLPEISLHSVDSALPPSSSVSIASNSTATFSVIEMPQPPPSEVPSPVVIQHPLQQFSSLLPQNLLSHVESGMKKITMSSTNLLNYASQPQLPPTYSTKDTDSMNSASLLGSMQDESFVNGSSPSNGPRSSFDAGGSGAAVDTLSLQSYNSGRFSSAAAGSGTQQLVDCTHYLTTRGRRLNRTAQQKQSAVPLYDVDNRLHWHVQQPSSDLTSAHGSGKLSISVVEPPTSTLFSGLLVPVRLKITNETKVPIRNADTCLVCMSRGAVIFPRAEHENVFYSTTKSTTDSVRRRNKPKVLSLLQSVPTHVDDGEVFLAPQASIEVPVLVKVRSVENFPVNSIFSAGMDGAAPKLDSNSYEVLAADAMTYDHSRRLSHVSLIGSNTADDSEGFTTEAESSEKIYRDKLQFMLVYNNTVHQPPVPGESAGAIHRRVSPQHHLAECNTAIKHRPSLECQIMCMPLKSSAENPSLPAGSLLLYIKVAHVHSGHTIRLRNFSCFDCSSTRLTSSHSHHHHQHQPTAASSLQIHDRLSSYRLITLQDDDLMASIQLISYPKVAFIALLAVPNSAAELALRPAATPLFFPPVKLVVDLTFSNLQQQQQQQQQSSRSPYAKARAGKRPSRAAVKRQEGSVATAAASDASLSTHFRLLWQLVSDGDLDNNAEVTKDDLFSADRATMAQIAEDACTSGVVGESVVLISETNRWFSF